MPLYDFLISHREEILADTKKKTEGISEDRPTSLESERGLPQFYDQLLAELKHGAQRPPKVGDHAAGPVLSSTTRHGQELFRLGYTISQVVHGYGVLCQAITEKASRIGEPISAHEFSILNLSLDVAIAEAVTAFGLHAGRARSEATTRMGVLIHELRNALAAATIAQSMIKKGIVGTSGNTNALLERNLRRMRDILDRSFSAVRLEKDETLDLRPTLLIEIAEDVEATAGEEARAKGLALRMDVDERLSVVADRNYLVSALSNLVQNALKYSKRGGVVKIRSAETEDHVRLEVEDQCGGLPPGKSEELFRPYTQKASDRSGLGLGLTISRQAVERIGGTLSVRDLPKKGCVFTIAIPKRPIRRSSAGKRAGAARRALGPRSLAGRRSRSYTIHKPVRAGA